MLIPHLHFLGNCEEAIRLYERAFDTKVEELIRNSDHSPGQYAGDRRIAHASMRIHGQTVFLNDNEAMFGSQDTSLNFPVHIILYFPTASALLDCYAILKDDAATDSPFVQTPYSALVGNFKDKFGMVWGFMVE